MTREKLLNNCLFLNPRNCFSRITRWAWCLVFEWIGIEATLEHRRNKETNKIWTRVNRVAINKAALPSFAAIYLTPSSRRGRKPLRANRSDRPLNASSIVPSLPGAVMDPYKVAFRCPLDFVGFPADVRYDC